LVSGILYFVFIDKIKICPKEKPQYFEVLLCVWAWFLSLRYRYVRYGADKVVERNWAPDVAWVPLENLVHAGFNLEDQKYFLQTPFGLFAHDVK
jgi:hypothetical protein